MTCVAGETWAADAGDPDLCPDNYQVTFGRGFRYDTPRARYLSREYNPIFLNLDPPQFVPESSVWTSDESDAAYGDFTVSGGNASHTASYEPGLWRSGSPGFAYLHNDAIGTLRVTTDATGAAETLRAYTAFGEPLTPPSDRYGYAGAWGYQAHEDFPFLHVGHRYYDPGSGRFLQRDPIGLRGGPNVYAYALNCPTKKTDPNGTFGFADALASVAIRGTLIGAVSGGLIAHLSGGNAWAGAVGGAIAGALTGFGVVAWVGGAIGGGVTGALDAFASADDITIEAGVNAFITGIFGGVGGRWGLLGALAGDLFAEAGTLYFWNIPRKLHDEMQANAGLWLWRSAGVAR